MMNSALMQVVDETNPISTLGHIMKITALGPGGLSSAARASMEVRDVHPTHFGRICPIETPEGPNVGLVTSLALCSQVEQDGRVTAPYRNVRTGEVEWLDAREEKSATILPRSTDYKEDEPDRIVNVRQGYSYGAVPLKEVTHVGVRPDQAISASAALIPFVSHDDANRALMGANMARQAVPLVNADPPLVGTGVEGDFGSLSSRNVIARSPGRVRYVSSNLIVVEGLGKRGSGKLITYRLSRCNTTNQGTDVSHKPRVSIGDRVKRGQLLADGPCSLNGELALGQNMVVAYMPWKGYNFEDSIVVSERVVKDDRFTSIHTTTLDCKARIHTNTSGGRSDKSLMADEITLDMPNISDRMKTNLDENGIVSIGAFVRPGDILVGRVSPNMKSEDTDMDRIVAALFSSVKLGKKWKSTPLICPSDVYGTVVNVRIIERDNEHETTSVVADRELDSIEEEFRVLRVIHRKRKASLLKRYRGNKAKQSEVREAYRALTEQLDLDEKERVDALVPGDLEPGVIKVVEVTIAVKAVLEVGDKLALRHGNKGVISKIVPVEDMPVMEDGRPIDVILNPLGVPSRMNIGQILECHLGLGLWKLGERIADMAEKKTRIPSILSKFRPVYSKDSEKHKKLRAFARKDPGAFYEYCKTLRNGIHVGTPGFNGASESDILRIFRAAGIPYRSQKVGLGVVKHPGQVWLYDGETGTRFQHPVTVGISYIQKLHHLVSKKMHARSTGPYSAVTQQPLGGRANAGGQRLGEMEVWALQAYGASYGLQELLTIKSDDIDGRERAFEAIVKNKPVSLRGTPASFNLLQKELQALALNFEGIGSDSTLSEG